MEQREAEWIEGDDSMARSLFMESSAAENGGKEREKETLSMRAQRPVENTVLAAKISTFL